MSGPDGPGARLAAVRSRVDAAATAAGRDPGAVLLLAVSKTHPLAAVDALAAAGQRDFGEARAQEFLPKAAERPQLRWHFVGRLQHNKARRVAERCALLHSLDRVELVAALDRGSAAAGRRLDVLVQLSLDGDPGRGGVAATGLGALAEAVARAANLRLAGVMAVAPRGADPRASFAALRAAGDALRREHPAAVQISAGMSQDLEAAVAEGATIVRVGTALFGDRAPLLG